MSQHDYAIANGSGAAVRTDINDVLAAIASNNSGATTPSTTFAYQWWFDTSTNILKIRNSTNTSWVNVASLSGTTWIPYRSGTLLGTASVVDTGLAAANVPTNTNLMSEAALTANSATPSVSGGYHFRTANSSGTTITGFSSPTAGQRIVVRCNDANTTIGAGLTKTGRAIPLVSGDVLDFYYDGAAWKQVGGTVGMGIWVPVTDGNNVGDMIANNQTSYADIDLSDDGVRKGACGVFIHINIQASAVQSSIRFRKNGSSSDDAALQRFETAKTTAGANNEETWGMVEPDDNGVIEGKVVSTLTSSALQMNVVGYWI